MPHSELKKDESLWTLQETADFLRVSEATIRRWTRSGKLQCYRLGGSESRRLFSTKHIHNFLAQYETQTQ